MGFRKDWLQKNDTNRKNELNEEQENYEILDNPINNKHDKTYRSILDSKKDATYIINQVLNLEQEIKQDEIEKYNSSFVTNDLQNKEADIVYKMKEKNIFFLIEHQSKVDYSMPYRLEEYRIEIIKSAIDIEKIKNKGYEIPEVIPIVIYTGKDNWNAKLYLHSIQDERFKNVNLQKYNLIDINNYEKETLIKSNYLIDKMFLIQRAEGQEETKKAIIQAVEATKDEKDKAKLIRIIKATLIKQVDKNKIEEIIKNKKGEVEVMEAVIEMLKREAIKEGLQEGMREGRREGMREGMREGRREGRREGLQEGLQKGRQEERKNIIKSIINNMLNKGIDVDGIKELTGIEKEEIEKIKKTIKG